MMTRYRWRWLELYWISICVSRKVSIAASFSSTTLLSSTRLFRAQLPSCDSHLRFETNVRLLTCSDATTREKYLAMIVITGKSCATSIEQSSSTNETLYANDDCFQYSSTSTTTSTHLVNGLYLDSSSPCDMTNVGWMARYRQVYIFQEHFGHTRVPKRYKDNPALGNWVNKQRQQYRHYLVGSRPCSLNANRIEMLNRINFCWDAASPSIDKIVPSYYDTLPEVNKERWWSHLEELRALSASSTPSEWLFHLPRQTKLGAWLDRQRKVYKACNHSESNPINSKYPKQSKGAEGSLSDGQIASLSEIDPRWWMSRRQWQWECRYQDLIFYLSQYGDCCVPISYKENKLLANWVSNQRKQYNLRMAGLSSDLTDERMHRLEAVGFVWNRWEYEFDKKGGTWNTSN